MDFVIITAKKTEMKKKTKVDIEPTFITKKSKDLMTRGGEFYAVWNEATGLWSTDEDTVADLVDSAVKAKTIEFENSIRKELKNDGYLPEQIDAALKTYEIIPHYMWNGDSGAKKKWVTLIKQLMANNNFHLLDQKLIFSNTKTKKEDYASKRLPYALEEGDHSAWDELVSTLYSPEERHKIEWAIGSIVNGDSKKIQKFFVLYGGPGTGKSTILNIIQMLFDGYWTSFDAKSIGSSNSEFALEQFNTNPLVAIQHDGDLSRINDNSKLNSLVSHEVMKVNEKFMKQYDAHFSAMLFVATNERVKITSINSGLIRRLIDINPIGEEARIPKRHYKELINKIKYELGAIAYYCKGVYEEATDYYDDYESKEMLESTNDIYNFLMDQFEEYSKMDGIGLDELYADYNQYCDVSQMQIRLNKTQFKSQMLPYFKKFSIRSSPDKNGKRRRNYFTGFKIEKFIRKDEVEDDDSKQELPDWLKFVEQPSVLDRELSDCPAQYAVQRSSGEGDQPGVAWSKCTTTLSDIKTSELHYVLPRGKHMIVLDIDIKGDDGKKNFNLCAKKAAEFPPTYAELSKSGEGIHLYYIYDGDMSKLRTTAEENVEIKTYPDDKNSTIRRKLTKCNNLSIATINSGLPLKEDRKKMVNKDAIITEKGLRSKIKKIVNREYDGVPSTISGVMLIKKILDEAYNSDTLYDVEDTKGSVIKFAEQSTNHMREALELVPKMHFKSEEVVVDVGATYPNKDLYAAFDIEVFPNLLIFCYLPITRKKLDELSEMTDKDTGKPTEECLNEINSMRQYAVKLINPDGDTLQKIGEKYKLFGFNNIRYDNYICGGRILGYSLRQCYRQSQKIINNEPGGTLMSFRDYSFTDVYDLSSKKQSLKKFEIELGFDHIENSYPWDQDLAEEHWQEVADYCVNDVLATVATLAYRWGDFIAREILSALSGLNMNATTNQHTTAIIFGNDKRPGLVYTDFMTGNVYGPGEPFKLPITSYDYYLEHKDDWKLMYNGAKPVLNIPSNCFPGYFYVQFPDGSLHNMYRGVDLGFGGYVYASPGMYLDGAVTYDVASEHPHSIKELNLFGKHTQNFVDLMDARIYIKHKDFEGAKHLFGGKLAPFLDDPKQAKALSKALKIAINSVYGLTSAKFENKFRDPRNVNNIVALRGALFMKTVQDAVEAKGFHVIHIKTDSIKIENPTPEIADFVMKMGEKYGYQFEIEHSWDRLCLVNNAVFIGKHGKDDPESPGAWDAVGTEFQIPYVFKTLFSHEEIRFEDLCETKSVTSALYLDCNEGLPDVRELEDFKLLRKKAASGGKIGKKLQQLLDERSDLSDEELDAEIAKGHNYSFVGKVGSFCPMKEGCGAGALMRLGKDSKGNPKYQTVTGGKWVEDGKEVNRWLESVVVKKLGKEKYIDRAYYQNKVDDAKADIEKFGSFEEFVA